MENKSLSEPTGNQEVREQVLQRNSRDLNSFTLLRQVWLLMPMVNIAYLAVTSLQTPFLVVDSPLDHWSFSTKTVNLSTTAIFLKLIQQRVSSINISASLSTVRTLLETRKHGLNFCQMSPKLETQMRKRRKNRLIQILKPLRNSRLHGDTTTSLIKNKTLEKLRVSLIKLWVKVYKSSTNLITQSQWVRPFKTLCLTSLRKKNTRVSSPSQMTVSLSSGKLLQSRCNPLSRMKTMTKFSAC